MNFPTMAAVRRLWGSRSRSRSLLFPALMLALMPGDAHSGDREQRKIAEAEAKTAAARGASTAGGAGSPSLPLPGCAGLYTDAWYGDISLTEENGRLVMRFTHAFHDRGFGALGP